MALVNALKNNFDLQCFKDNFSDIGSIWQIFLLHIIQPIQFPIFDQHVYRAHIFLINKKVSEIPDSPQKKLKYFENDYLPFFETLKLDISDLKKIDEALWAFAKFLKTDYAKKILE